MVSEWKHGMTFLMVWAILHDSRLPQNLWALAVTYIMYTLNLMPSVQNSSKIPAELFYRTQQDVSHLWLFGAREWATLVDGKGGKIDSWATEGRMVRYGERGVYWLYLPSGSIIQSWDVVFEEGCPMWMLESLLIWGEDDNYTDTQINNRSNSKDPENDGGANSASLVPKTLSQTPNQIEDQPQAFTPCCFPWEHQGSPLVLGSCFRTDTKMPRRAISKMLRG